MHTLRIQLFGRFEVWCGEQIVVALNACKVQELLCYLLLYRDRPHPRESLASLLWSETSTTRSKGYLRKALWQLQTALDTQAVRFRNPVVMVEPDWVQINPEAHLWLDVAVFEQAFALVQDVPDEELGHRRAKVIRDAVDLYRGDLLEGWYQDWCLYERERFQCTYLAMLDKLMGYCEASRNYEAGLAYGRRILRYDRARECTHRRLMRLYYLAGDRTAALRHYEHCVAVLNEDLGVKPSRSTLELYEQIRADRLDAGIMLPINTSASQRATGAPLSELPGHLRRLHGALSDVQHQLQQDIQTVELALNDR